MNIPLLARPDLLRSQRRSSAVRALAFMVALLFVLCSSLSAEAKKKKAKGKKGKTPSSSSKSTKEKEAAPADESEDEAGGDEKASSKKAPADEDEEKAAAKPAAPAPEGEGEGAPPRKSPKPAPAAEGEGTPGGLAALRFGVGGKALFRNLTWNADMNALAPYTLSPGPEIGAWLEAYPAAFATDGFAANIGVYGGFRFRHRAGGKVCGGEGKMTRKRPGLPAR